VPTIGVIDSRARRWRVGVQSDYLIADESEAATIRGALCPLTDGRWKGIDAKGFDMVPMSELTAVLTGEADVGKLIDEWVSLSPDEDGDTWLCKVPDRLVNCLLALEDERLEQVAHDWVAQESFPGKWYIEMKHGNRREGILTKLFGRSRGAAVKEEPPDFSSLLPVAKEMLVEFRSLAKEAKEHGKSLLMWGST
jgi:hypothetical protein